MWLCHVQHAVHAPAVDVCATTNIEMRVVAVLPYD